MPCISTYPDEDRFNREQKAAMVSASLCAVLRALEEAGFDLFDKSTSVAKLIDWEEAGVKPAHLAEWWAEHKRKDAERLEREKKEAEDKLNRLKMLAKLTADEREAIGITLTKAEMKALLEK